MGLHTWSFDAPSGSYKNHALSSQLRFAAIAETKMLQFVKPEPGYGRKRGESVTLTRISNLTVPTDGKLVENNKIPEDDLTITSVSITVSEWGRSVPYTSFAEDLSAYDLTNIVQMKLRDQMKLVMDDAAADAFKTAQVKATATGVAAINYDTAGTVTGTATANLNTFHVESIRDSLFSTYNAPPFEGDDYIGLISTKAKRGLMSDPAWEEWKKYTDPQSKFNSEVGRLENIRFIEINNTNALSASPGASQTAMGEGLFFGADAVAMAVSTDPELRAAIPQDFGRQKSVAWYGVLEFGIVWDTSNAGEARIIHLTSA